MSETPLYEKSTMEEEYTGSVRSMVAPHECEVASFQRSTSLEEVRTREMESQTRPPMLFCWARSDGSRSSHPSSWNSRSAIHPCARCHQLHSLPLGDPSGRELNS